MAILEFSRRYSMAHRLIAVDSPKRAVPHGHNEIVTVRLAPAAPFQFSETNAAAPFAQIKGRWHGWIDDAVDHALHLNAADPLIAFFREKEPARLSQLMIFAGDPTTEALTACFFLKLSAFLAADGPPYVVEEVRVQETPTNTVALTRATFDAERCGLPANTWARRADMSINDL